MTACKQVCKITNYSIPVAYVPSGTHRINLRVSHVEAVLENDPIWFTLSNKKLGCTWKSKPVCR